MRVEGFLVENSLWDLVETGVTALPPAPGSSASADARAAYVAAQSTHRAELASDAKAKALIKRYTSRPYLQLVHDAASAKEAWASLESEFTQVSVARQTQLQQRLSLLRMQPDETVANFFSRIYQLKSDLEACNCSISESNIVLTVIANLTSDYKPSAQQLRYEQTGPTGLTLSRVKRVMQFREADLLLEQQQEHASSPSSLFAFSSSSSRGPANAEDDYLVPLQTYNTDLYEPFYIDSGASQHMITDREHFSSYTAFRPDEHKAVRLAADGHVIYAVGQGTVWLNTQRGPWQLSKALHVPASRHSFISVSAATDDGASFTFTDDQCIIKDTRLRVKARKFKSSYILAAVPLPADPYGIQQPHLHSYSAAAPCSSYSTAATQTDAPVPGVSSAAMPEATQPAPTEFSTTSAQDIEGHSIEHSSGSSRGSRGNNGNTGRSRSCSSSIISISGSSYSGNTGSSDNSGSSGNTGSSSYNSRGSSGNSSNSRGSRGNNGNTGSSNRCSSFSSNSSISSGSGYSGNTGSSDNSGNTGSSSSNSRGSSSSSSSNSSGSRGNNGNTGSSRSCSSRSCSSNSSISSSGSGYSGNTGSSDSSGNTGSSSSSSSRGSSSGGSSSSSSSRGSSSSGGSSGSRGNNGNTGSSRSCSSSNNSKRQWLQRQHWQQRQQRQHRQQQQRDCAETRPEQGGGIGNEMAEARRLVHMDVCGPISPPARDGSLYLATFLDDFTRLSVVMPMRSKAQVPSIVKQVIEQLETQSGQRCKAIRTDNGTEYVNKQMQQYCSDKGIIHQHSAPYSPEQNGAAERLNRTIMEKARSILHAGRMGLHHWADAAKLSNYVRCVLPVSDQPLTPWESFFGVKPDLSGLRVFGSAVWVHVPAHKRSKLEAKAVWGVFVGYQLGSKSYRVLVNGKEYHSKDVVFDEQLIQHMPTGPATQLQFSGAIEKFKARLVAKGYMQVSGVDVGDVYAPVSKHTTLRTLLAKAAAEDMEVHQVDVDAAFLNGQLEPNEIIYVQQPEGFVEGSHNIVCKLQKALYGLRQAPRAWHARLKQVLEGMGFRASESDPALFTMQRQAGMVYLLVYVDDCLICTEKGDTDSLNYVKQQLSAVFGIKNLGDTKWFLGMKVTRDRNLGTLKLDQQQYVHELLNTYGMTAAHSKSVPMAPAVKLEKEGVALDTSEHSYSGLVGSLLYLSCCTRPDITYAVGALARYMSAPTQQHWTAARAILSYLKGTADQGLVFGEAAELQGYCDADYAGDKDTARSTTGYVFAMNGAAISWSSRLQPTVAMSTAEAEYMAASSAVKEGLWLRKLMQDLQLPGLGHGSAGSGAEAAAATAASAAAAVATAATLAAATAAATPAAAAAAARAAAAAVAAAAAAARAAAAAVVAVVAAGATTATLAAAEAAAAATTASGSGYSGNTGSSDSSGNTGNSSSGIALVGDAQHEL
ncbi:hypothetical protein QJQ45_012781 [Haematococcus lacustris]|nr:hypothetical protein QJQ45_012781 [Haematococcus lacustris]